MNFGATDMEIGLPVKKWKAGQIIQDIQDITLRPDWRSPVVTLYIGLVEEHGHQLGDRMAASGLRFVDRAVVARAIEVDSVESAATARHGVRAAHVGRHHDRRYAVDPTWANAASSVDFVNADGSPDPNGKATARMLWDEQNLYVYSRSPTPTCSVRTSNTTSRYGKPIASNCSSMPTAIAAGTSSCRSIPTTRRSIRTLRRRARKPAMRSGSRRCRPRSKFAARRIRVATPIRDGCRDRDSARRGQRQQDAMPVRLPPQLGDKWRLNVVRVDYRSGGGGPGVGSWNRITYADFHALDRMLTVVFADPNGSISPTSDAAGSAAPPTGSATPPTGSATPPIGSAAPTPPPAGSAAPTWSAAPTGSAKPVIEGAVKEPPPQARRSVRHRAARRVPRIAATRRAHRRAARTIRSQRSARATHRAVKRVVLASIASLAIGACSTGSRRVGSQPSWRGNGTSTAVGPVTFAPASEPARNYNEPLQEPSHTPLGDALFAAIKEAAAKANVAAPVADARLFRACAELAEVVPEDGLVAYSVVEFALQRHGIIEPSPHNIIVWGEVDKPDKIIEQLKAPARRELGREQRHARRHRRRQARR